MIYNIVSTGVFARAEWPVGEHCDIPDVAESLAYI